MPAARVCPACNGAGHVPEPDPAAPGYYFGCWADSGHYLWLPSGSKAWSIKGCEEALPQTLRSPDGTLTPGARDRHGRNIDPQVEGLAALHHIEGWTALAFWDRSVDRRGNSNSVFIVRGMLTFDEIVARSRELFPSVWARFRFAVREDRGMPEEP